MRSERRTYTVEELVRAGVLAPPIDGNHGEIHPKTSDFVERGVPFIMASDMKDGRVDTKNCAFITVEQASSLRKGFSTSGDVLLSHKATLGRTAIVERGAFDFLVLTPQVTYYRVLDPKVLNNRYLKYYFDSEPFQQTLAAWAGAGSTRAYLGITAQRKLPIVLPPVETQDWIAGAMGALDDRIALLRETNATLEDIAQALFKSWFVDFDTVRAKQQGAPPADMDEATAALFPDSFEASALGSAPKGWRPSVLGDIVRTIKSQVKPSDLHAAMKYVGLEHLPRKSLSLVNWDAADGLESAKAQFSEGDVLFGKLRPYFHKVVVAPFDGVCSTDILVCQSKLRAYYGFAVMQLFSAELIAYADRLSNGAKMPRIGWGDLAAYPLIIPTEPVASAFTGVVYPLLDQMKSNVFRAQTLADLRDTLLPRLVSGQLRMPDAEALID